MLALVEASLAQTKTVRFRISPVLFSWVRESKVSHVETLDARIDIDALDFCTFDGDDKA